MVKGDNNLVSEHSILSMSARLRVRGWWRLSWKEPSSCLCFCLHCEAWDMGLCSKFLAYLLYRKSPIPCIRHSIVVLCMVKNISIPQDNPYVGNINRDAYKNNIPSGKKLCRAYLLLSTVITWSFFMWTQLLSHISILSLKLFKLLSPLTVSYYYLFM